MIINYTAFENELSKQFSKFPKAITEDLVRWLFINVHPNTEMEVPYMRSALPCTPIKIKPNKTGCFASTRMRADLVSTKDDAVIEFKCHRKTAYSTCCTATDMGAVFCDLNRLSCLANREKYFIYVFDGRMKNYYDGVMKKHTKNCPLQMFDVSPSAVGNSFMVDKNLDGVTCSYKEFTKKAFSSFVSTHKKFACFDYAIDVLYAQKIGTTDFYIIVARVK